jgi:hypothetical protein
MVPLGVEFTFLPDPVDIGFVGTGSALGAVALGLMGWVRAREPAEIAEDAALGALALGIVAFLVWFLGLVGLQFQ